MVGGACATERDLTMMMVENQEVCELFKTQIQCLFVCLCLHSHTIAIIHFLD